MLCGTAKKTSLLKYTINQRKSMSHTKLDSNYVFTPFLESQCCQLLYLLANKQKINDQNASFSLELKKCCIELTFFRLTFVRPNQIPQQHCECCLLLSVNDSTIVEMLKIKWIFFLAFTFDCYFVCIGRTEDVMIW